MITVNTGPRAPVRVELEGGAWIEFKPWSTFGHVAGQQAALTALTAGEDPGVATVGYTIALARWGALAWAGVGDETGAPLELTADNVEALLSQSPDAYRRVDQGYAWPALQEELEKNGSAPAPAGGSPARARGSAAGTTAKPAKGRARTAPSSRTSPKPKPARRRGG